MIEKINWQEKSLTYCYEKRMISKKDSHLILNPIRLILHYPNRPTIYIPSKMNHAVLLSQIIIVLLL